jgi:RNA polymerase sigma-70 factor (ECF subfamily)
VTKRFGWVTLSSPEALCGVELFQTWPCALCRLTTLPLPYQALSNRQRKHSFLRKNFREDYATEVCLKGRVITVNDAPKAELLFEERELVARAASGDRAAFAQIYERYYARAFRLAYSFTGSASGAEDLTQEIFMRAYQRLESFGGQSSFATWFYRLAVNHSLNYRRKEKLGLQDHAPERLERLAHPSTRVEAEVLQNQIKSEIHAALLELQEEMRMVIILKDIEGLNYDEISERMNCSQGTVASRLNRARKQLAEKLKHLKGAY